MFAAQGGSLRSPAETSPEEVASQPNVSAEAAVKVAGDFGTETSQAERSARQSRVEELKKSVASGSYKPDSGEVAKAVFRELFS